MTTLDFRFRGNDSFWDGIVMTIQDYNFLSVNFGYEVFHSSKLDGLPSDPRFHGNDMFCDKKVITTYKSNNYL